MSTCTVLLPADRCAGREGRPRAMAWQLLIRFT
jgi:hypothetical protein